MSNLYHTVPAGKNPPDEFNVVVEIVSGTSSKMEYDEEGGYMTLDRVLYSPMYYPFEYGFIPQSKSGDGDALDVILLTTHATFPLCVVRARPLGMLRMVDEAGVDNKLLAVPVEKVDPRMADIQTIDDVSKHLKKEIELFMADYKKLEPGKYEHVKIDGWAGKDEAKAEILSAIQKYKDEHGERNCPVP